MLTDQEKEIVEGLGLVWNAFLQLPREHPMDRGEFCKAIHDAQRQILMRSGRREINGLADPE